jgi:3-oxoacyl-[acyl-carrier-protein] synthase-3
VVEHRGGAFHRHAEALARGLDDPDVRLVGDDERELGGYIQMEGKEVFRRAVRIMVDSATKSMNHAGVTADQIALVVPHQANIRIIEAACARLGIPMEKAATVLHYTGNTSSASIPLAMNAALDAGRVAKGDLVLLVGFGAGMTAASALLRWGGDEQ